MRFPTLSPPTADISSFLASGTILHVLGALIVLGAVLLCTPAQAQTIFTVSNTNNGGAGSLRQAIVDANSTPNGGQPDAIHFVIDAQTDPGCDSATGVCTIALQNGLPSITEAVVIDGETQTGADCGTDIPSRTLKIVLDGTTSTGPGIGLHSSGSTVRGLVINQVNSIGVSLFGSSTTNNVVACNFIGTDITGTIDLGNGGPGILASGGASDNTIGGTEAGAGNLISGNDVIGVRLSGEGVTGNMVQGNFIGIDVTGTVALSNAFDGVAIENGASDNVIGGTTAAARNVISGNSNYGVRIDDDGSTGNVIQGNFIGTDVSGTQGIHNGWDGVRIEGGADDNVVGGTASGSGNLISGNGDPGGGSGYGVALAGPGSTGNVVQGNFIGTDVTGTVALGNRLSGMILIQVTNSIIGGTVPAMSSLVMLETVST